MCFGDDQNLVGGDCSIQRCRPTPARLRPIPFNAPGETHDLNNHGFFAAGNIAKLGKVRSQSQGPAAFNTTSRNSRSERQTFAQPSSLNGGENLHLNLHLALILSFGIPT